MTLADRASIFTRLAKSALTSLTALTVLVVLGAAPAPAHAQLAAQIVAANAAGSDIYAVDFSGTNGTATVLNTDANAHTSIRSLVFRPDPDTGSVDLIAADTPRGEILLYRQGIGNAIVVWTPGTAVANPLEGNGPVRPDGLSIDGEGNLYVVSSASGNSIAPELWVFPRNSFGPLPGGFGLPRLVDNDFGPAQLVETLTVRVTGNIAPVGSLLVLTSAPNRVLAYSAASLASVLAGGGETDPTTLIANTQFPSGTAPGGMDIWPLDGGLLVTSYDRILRFSSTAVSLPDFATGLGNGVNNKFKIRATRIGTTAVAVIADNSNGRLVQFNAAGTITSTITSGVNRPQALATTNAATAFANCYLQAAGCDLLGGVLKHRALNAPSQSTSGFLLQEPCVVNTDPRFNTATGVWSDVPLSINSVCPGFGTSIIPAYLRGGSGPSGRGFAIVSSTSDFLLPLGVEVASEIFSENILGAKPMCAEPYSAEIVTWAPTDGEGTIVEGAGQLDATLGCRNPLLAGTRGGSDWTFGLVVDTTSGALPGTTPAQKLHGFSSAKYVNLIATVEAAQIQRKVKSSLVSCLTTSKRDFDKFNYAAAQLQLLVCDSQVRSAYAVKPGDFVPTAANPNPYGEIVTRIANLDYTIRYRQLNGPL